MKPNYTINYTVNDAFHDGFECGLLYALRYAEEVLNQRMDINVVAQLANHLESMKPWKSNEEWNTLILSNIIK